MDDIVKQAMLKWPNVPDCYGWLGLDARGNWYMRDDRTQAQGSFTSKATGAKGSMLTHAKLITFIERNYACDALGRWYFQNGPQRVYVELEATPWVWRLSTDTPIRITAHDGQNTTYRQGYLDENGWLYLATTLGFGLVHTQDVHCAVAALENGEWSVQDVQRSSLATAHGYIQSPQAQQMQTV